MHVTLDASPGVSILTLLSWGDAGYADELFFGALSTFFIAILAFGLGLALGFGAAIARFSAISMLRQISWIYSTLFRAVPELVLILILYYAGGDLVTLAAKALGLGAVAFNGPTAAVVVLGLVQGAYAGEVLRGAILAVPQGYKEAALSLGLSQAQTFRYVSLPLMLPLALPGLSNLWLSLTKATALVSVVGYTELTLATQQAAGSSKLYFVMYGAALLLYWWLSVVSGRLFARLENHFRRYQAPLAVGSGA